MIENLTPDEKYTNWAGIPVTLGPNKKAQALCMGGKRVAWIVWSEIEVDGEHCVSVDSIFCHLEYRGNGYGKRLFDQLSQNHPDQKILGMFENPVVAGWAYQHNERAKLLSLRSKFASHG